MLARGAKPRFLGPVFGGGVGGCIRSRAFGHVPSLQSGTMEILNRFLERLERVLPFAEKILREFAGVPPDASFFSEHRAFRWDAGRGPGRLIAIERPADFDLGDLMGVEESIARLTANTEQFLGGLPFNHVLLYGERGTGKSSAVKGLCGRYAERGLRLVEVNREDLIHLPAVLEALREGEEFRFLIFCDDLSFGSDEVGFRELKAALEGRLEAPPENVCLIATSNRRHLLPETMADNREARVDAAGELHLGEALEEKLALSDRFGLTLGFFGFDQETYLAIVRHYAADAGVDEAWESVQAEALRWALERSSRSGRTARQFVDDFVGRRGLERSESRSQ